jgi:hypothetical protein
VDSPRIGREPPGAKTRVGRRGLSWRRLLAADAVAIPSAPRAADDRSINDQPTDETARGTAEADPAGRH